MNPSTGGWIKKLMQELEERNTFLNESQIDFYNALKQSGFIYGSNTHIVEQLVNEDDLTDMEMSKVNLFLALHFTHHQANTSTDLFESLIGFYKEIKVHRPSFSFRATSFFTI